MSDQETFRGKDFLVTVLLEEARSAIWKTQARMEPRDLIDRVWQELREITSGIGLENPEQDAFVWRRIGDLLIRRAYETRPYCVRCGECCKNHAPTLLMDDMVLLNRNIIRPEHLYTVRRGELGYCNFKDETVELEFEMIKVKSKTGSSTCIFFQGFDGSCSIYENRPSQCRIQECWTPESTLPTQAQISRKDIFKGVETLWKVICAHEERCSHDEWKKALSRLEVTRGQSVEELLAILRYDQTVREFVSEKFGVNEEVIELIVGRPMENFLSVHGLELLHSSDGACMLKPMEEH